MASILKPASEAIPLLMKLHPNGDTCNVPQFLDCAWALPSEQRRGDVLFSGACAEQSGCKPEFPEGSPEQNQTGQEAFIKIREL